MHQSVYAILRDTGRRPGEVVSLKIDCVEVIGSTHNLIYDNNRAARMRRRLPISAETAAMILAWQEHRLDMAVARDFFGLWGARRGPRSAILRTTSILTPRPC